MSKMRPSLRVAAALGLTALAYCDFAASFMPGDISSPGGYLPMVLDKSVGRSPIQRALISRDFLFDDADAFSLGLDSGPRKTIAMLNEENTGIMVFMGSGAQNRLYLADSLKGLAHSAEQHHADLIVITKRANPSYGSEEIAKQTISRDLPDYQWVVDSKKYMIARRVS